MIEVLKKIWDDISGLWSLVVGLKVTGRRFISREITIHYPRQTVPNLESFRGPIELVPKEDNPSKSRCIACMNCVTVCPSGCYTVVRKEAPPEVEKEEGVGASDGSDEGKKKKAPKEPATFVYDYSLCSQCGICVENCPSDSLRFSSRGYMSGLSREDFILDLLSVFGRG